MRTAGAKKSRQYGAGSATVILAILLVLLVAVTAYLLVTYYSQNSTLETLEKELSQTKFDLNRANSSLEQAEQDKQSADRELSNVRGQLEKLRNSGDDRLSALQQRIREYGQQQQKNENTLKEQQQQLAECATLAEKLETADKRITELTSEGQELEKCRKDLAENQDKLQETLQDTKETGELADRLTTCEQQLAEAKEREKSATAVTAAVSEQPVSSAPENGAQDSRIDALEKEISRLQADLDSCRKPVSTGEDDSAAKCAALETQVSQLTTEIATCRKDLQEQGGKPTDDDVAEVKKTYESLIKDLKQEVNDKEVTIEQFKDKVKIQIVGQILFPSGSSHITPKGREVLQKLQKTFSEFQNKQIYVVGHTDDVDIKAAFLYWVPSNWELSAKRAAAVVRYLVNKAGVNPERLAAVGRSYYEPVGDNDTPEGRAKNRRVEIIVSNDLRLQ